MDLDKLTAAAVESFLRGNQIAGKAEPKRRRFQGLGGVAVGVGLAVVARAAYNRVRNLDLEQLGAIAEERLKR